MQVAPWAQVVSPVQPVPPHWPYRVCWAAAMLAKARIAWKVYIFVVGLIIKMKMKEREKNNFRIEEGVEEVKDVLEDYTVQILWPDFRLGIDMLVKEHATGCIEGLGYMTAA